MQGNCISKGITKFERKLHKFWFHSNLELHPNVAYLFNMFSVFLSQFKHYLLLNHLIITEYGLKRKNYHNPSIPTIRASIEWMAEDDCNTLLIYLPGFSKEQLRVQLRSKTLIISGERKLHDNTWTRFRKEFLVSEQCVLSKISAKFEGSILFVKQPKSIASLAKQEGKPPIEAPSPKPENPIDETKKHQKAEQVEHDTKPTSTAQLNGKTGVGRNAEFLDPKGVCENASEKNVSDLGLMMKMPPSSNALNKVLILVVGFVLGVYCSNAIKSWIG